MLQTIETQNMLVSKKVLQIIKNVIMPAHEDGKQLAYISGKVTGLDSVIARSHFDEAEAALSRRGYYCFNPMTHLSPTCNWYVAMRICSAVLPLCDKVFTLHNAPDSKGAGVEINQAKSLEMFVSADIQHF